jgi:predicted CoA-binding protein
MGKTVVIGASENPERYSNRAVKSLVQHNEPVVAIGLKTGKIGEVEILADFPKLDDVETVTLYVGPQNQPSWYDYILSLKPKRVIFNPGTENAEFEKMCTDAGIETIEACTLVMLSVGTY